MSWVTPFGRSIAPLLGDFLHEAFPSVDLQGLRGNNNCRPASANPQDSSEFERDHACLLLDVEPLQPENPE